jgi:hypothetical protein
LKLWDLRVSVGLQRIEDSSDVPVTADSSLFHVETSREFANIDNVSINVISSAPAGKAFIAYAVDINSGDPSSFKADIRFTSGETFGDSGFPATVDFTWLAVGK